MIARFLLRPTLVLALAAGCGLAWADPALPPAAQAASAAEAGAQQTGGLRHWLSDNGVARGVAGASTQASNLVVNALGFLGVKYRYGGHNASTGFDCSGFVSHVYQQTLGLVLPHNARAQSRDGERVDIAELQPGDLVFFNTLRRAFSHVGIYIGNGQFVHAPRPGQKIQIGDLSSPYWARHFAGARRLIGQVTDALPDAAAAVRANASTTPAPTAGADLPPTN